MQMHPHEAWDLLDASRADWAGGAESARGLHRLLRELRNASDERDWDLLSRMSADYFSDPQAHAQTTRSRREPRTTSAWPAHTRSSALLTTASRAEAAKGLPPDARRGMDKWLRRHTPMRDRVFRNTRQTLRAYKAQGLLPPDDEHPGPARRGPSSSRSTADEQQLYERIETYISPLLQHLLGRQPGPQALGFIMTVYRRRLTSSFLAIERSLQRRLDVLLGREPLSELLDDGRRRRA